MTKKEIKKRIDDDILYYLTDTIEHYKNQNFLADSYLNKTIGILNTAESLGVITLYDWKIIIQKFYEMRSRMISEYGLPY